MLGLQQNDGSADGSDSAQPPGEAAPFNLCIIIQQQQHNFIIQLVKQKRRKTATVPSRPAPGHRLSSDPARRSSVTSHAPRGTERGHVTWVTERGGGGGRDGSRDLGHGAGRGIVRGEVAGPFLEGLAHAPHLRRVCVCVCVCVCV